MKILLRIALATLLLVLAVGCSDDSGDSGGSGDSGDSSSVGSGVEEKVKVELGEEFTWNDFTATKGWKLETTTAMIEMEESDQPSVSGELTNNGDEARFAIFEMLFVGDGKLQATMICRTDDELAPGDTGTFKCPGLGQVVPEGYDLIQVQQFQR